MAFPTAQGMLEHYRKLEAGARRTHGTGALHPDQCPKLALHGVEFAIPPRGVRIAPKFTGDEVLVSMAGEDDWPEADELVAPVMEYGKCPACGRARRAALKLEVAGASGFLPKCFGLAARLLRKQYDLTDGQMTELLAFERGQLSQWITQLLQWCNGLSTEVQEVDSLDIEEDEVDVPLDCLRAMTAMGEDQLAGKRRPGRKWWRVWRGGTK